MWEKATPRKKRFKVLLWGPPGCFKTRTILRLGNKEEGDPVLAMADLEFGSDHYGGEFNFLRSQSVDPDEIMKNVKSIAEKPEGIKIIGFDGFSIYYEAVTVKWADLFKKREITSSGQRGEYYNIQPRDYVHINREVHGLVKIMLKSDLHVLATCQSKDQWGDNMKVIGKTFDGPKRIPFYFDTVIEIQEASNAAKKKGKVWEAYVRGKDRSGVFAPNTEIPWENDKVAAEFLISKWGDLTQGSDAEPVVEERKEEKKEEKKEQQAEAKPTEEKEESREPGNESSKTEFTDDEIRALKMSIVKSKNALAVRNINEWKKRCKMAFNVESVNEMTTEQMQQFDKQLKEEAAKKNPT